MPLHLSSGSYEYADFERILAFVKASGYSRAPDYSLGLPHLFYSSAFSMTAENDQIE